MWNIKNVKSKVKNLLLDNWKAISCMFLIFLGCWKLYGFVSAVFIVTLYGANMFLFTKMIKKIK